MCNGARPIQTILIVTDELPTERKCYDVCTVDGFPCFQGAGSTLGGFQDAYPARRSIKDHTEPPSETGVFVNNTPTQEGVETILALSSCCA